MEANDAEKVGGLSRLIGTDGSLAGHLYDAGGVAGGLNAARMKSVRAHIRRSRTAAVPADRLDRHQQLVRLRYPCIYAGFMRASFMAPSLARARGLLGLAAGHGGD